MQTQETKATQLSGATMVKDEGDGIVTALVSVTGIVDNVKDIIEPGAYADTLKSRKPKGIWHHQWTDPIAKTLSAEELMPGDERLPKVLPNGDPWPREAGGLLVKMQFNLDSDRGRRAYSDVKFYGDEQEWSIGYNVPQGHATKDTKTGIRRIKKIDLFEYSPVLFGAASPARTMANVKALFDDAGIDFKAFIKEMITEMGAEQDAKEEKADEFDVDSLADQEDFEDEGGPGAKTVDPTAVRKAIAALQELLGGLESGNGEADMPQEGNDPNAQAKMVPTAYVEVKAMEYLTMTEAFDGLAIPMVKSTENTLGAAISVFDDAYEAGNKSAMEKAGTGIMDLVETLYEEAETYGDDIKAANLSVLTQVMADQFANVSKLTPEAKSYDVYASGAIEWKNAIVESRQLGWPVLVDGGTVSRKSRQTALLDSMDDDDLVDLADYLDTSGTDRGMKRYVESLLDDRRDSESGSETKKMRTQEETDKLGAKGMAFKNGNGEYAYPVENRADLHNACLAYGRAMDSDKPGLMAYLKKRAKALGAEDMLPASWDEKSAVFSMTELKELGLDMEGLDAFN